MAKKKADDAVGSDEKQGSRATTVAQIAAQMNRRCGAGTMILGREMKVDPPRLPTGVFSVDFATGGGLPLNASSCFWGPESGGKTTLAINAMVMAQSICWRCFQLVDHCECSQSAMRMLTTWLDVEGTFDRDWAASIGADPDRYLLTLADYGEQYIDIAQAVLKADDCGLVVFDSLAALSPVAEMEAAAESQFMARQAAMIGRAVRNIKQQLIRERKRDHPCLVLFINQMRVKLGQMFGDPETMSGGWGMKHEFSLLLRSAKRTLKKDGPDKKYVDEGRKKNMADRFAFSIRKAKVATLVGLGEYVRMTEDIPDLNLDKGQVDDFTTLMTYAKSYGVVEKDGSKWRYFGYKADGLDQIKQVWQQNLGEKMRTQGAIISRAKARLCGDTEAEETNTPEELD